MSNVVLIYVEYDPRRPVLVYSIQVFHNDNDDENKASYTKIVWSVLINDYFSCPDLEKGDNLLSKEAEKPEDSTSVQLKLPDTRNQSHISFYMRDLKIAHLNKFWYNYTRIWCKTRYRVSHTYIITEPFNKAAVIFLESFVLPFINFVAVMIRYIDVRHYLCVPWT